MQYNILSQIACPLDLPFPFLCSIQILSYCYYALSFFCFFFVFIGTVCVFENKCAFLNRTRDKVVVNGFVRRSNISNFSLNLIFMTTFRSISSIIGARFIILWSLNFQFCVRVASNSSLSYYCYVHNIKIIQRSIPSDNSSNFVRAIPSPLSFKRLQYVPCDDRSWM